MSSIHMKILKSLQKRLENSLKNSDEYTHCIYLCIMLKEFVDFSTHHSEALEIYQYLKKKLGKHENSSIAFWAMEKENISSPEDGRTFFLQKYNVTHPSRALNLLRLEIIEEMKTHFSLKIFDDVKEVPND